MLSWPAQIKGRFLSLKSDLTANIKLNFKTSLVTYVIISCLVIFSICFGGCQKPVEKKLPPIEDLDELELVQVADFMEITELASHAIPVISDDDEIFFYDFRMKQLFKSDIFSQKLIPLGRSGEGPGEYTSIIGLLLENDNLYFLDGHRKIVCLDTKGNLIWEEKFEPNFIGIIGKRGESFYFIEMKTDEDLRFMMGLTEWTRAQGPQMLCEKPILTVQSNAMVEGKVVEGGGFFFLANPAFAQIGDVFAVSASNKYEFDFLDLDGSIIHTYTFRAPSPDMTEMMMKMKKNFKSIDSIKNYAIAKILSLNEELFIVSHYYLDGKPRIDRFFLSGDLLSSHILPLDFNPPYKDVVIQGGYLVYIDRDYPGFKIFQIDHQNSD